MLIRRFGAGLLMLGILLGIIGDLNAQDASAGAKQQEKTLWQPYYISPRTGQQHVSLDGQWELTHRDKPVESVSALAQPQKWIHAQIPDSVQWSLYRAGELPNPYYHLNSRKYAWVPDKVWYYRRTFQVPSTAAGQYVFLCFDGIGYYSKLWLNGILLGRHEGMFGGPEVEVSKLLHPAGPNELIVEVRAGSYGVENWDPIDTGKVVLPWGSAGGNADVTYASGIGLKELLPLGIWQGVRLEIVPHVHLERPFLTTTDATAGEAHLALTTEVLVNKQSLQFQLHPSHDDILQGFLDPLRAPAPEGHLELRVRFTQEDGSRTVLEQRFPLRIYEGKNYVQEQIRIPSPKLWWPNGMGEPNLYRVQLTLLRKGEPLDSLEFDFGIRTIRTVPSAGPRTRDRWANWQFVVNGRPLFIKGVNWAWPLDILLHLPEEKYRWLLEAARNGNIQMIRVWGGANPETDEFYRLCDRLGIMVWEDFPVANDDTPEWPQDVWEAQVLQNIFRLRNHSSLAVWCGGNEINPYDPGNTATIGIVERSVRDFDGTRMFLRTTPDSGDAHPYSDMDPTWYGHLYTSLPFISETGMFNMPEPESLREIIDPQELNGSFQDIFSKTYADRHPDFIHHLLEYGSLDVHMLFDRASQMDDLSTVDLDGLSSIAQLASAEYAQIYSDLTQANYPVTTGLMPWSFTVPWPIVFPMLVDGLGEPTVSYYALKRTYEPTHILVRLPELVWAKGEKIPISISVVHASPENVAALKVSVQILDRHFHPVWTEKRQMDVPSGPSAKRLDLGDFTIPDSFEDKFFFVIAEARRADGSLISRSVYWPRCLKMMNDPDFRTKYRNGNFQMLRDRNAPQRSLRFEHGPWLRPQVAAVPTSLKLTAISRKDISANESEVRVRLRNTGTRPAFDVHVNIIGTKRAFYGTDNYLWLKQGEERTVDFHVLWRDPLTRPSALITVGAWNADLQQVPMPAAR